MNKWLKLKQMLGMITHGKLNQLFFLMLQETMLGTLMSMIKLIIQFIKRLLQQDTMIKNSSLHIHGQWIQMLHLHQMIQKMSSKNVKLMPCFNSNKLDLLMRKDLL